MGIVQYIKIVYFKKCPKCNGNMRQVGYSSYVCNGCKKKIKIMGV